MAVATLYDYKGSIYTEIEETYNNVGASNFDLGTIRRGFKESTLVIWSATGKTGTQLVKDTDFTIASQDSFYTDKIGFDVYSEINVSNVTYQTGNIFISYEIVGSYIEKLTDDTQTSAIATNVSNIATNVSDISVLESNNNVNSIINPEFSIWQEGTAITAATTPANSDDTYVSDQWILLSDGNDVVDVSRSTDAPTGSKYSCKSLVATANKKFGYLQIIEGVESYKHIAGTVSVSFQAKTTTAKVIENLRCTVVSWDSTEDTVTSDIISAWAVEGTNPTLVANWTAENVAVNIPITTSWATYSIENISIDTASTTNIALFIWVDDTDAATGDELFLSQVQLKKGATIVPFQSRQFQHEVDLCERFFEKSYEIDTAPGTATGNNMISELGLNTFATYESYKEYNVIKRIVPSVTLYSVNTGTSGKVYDLEATTDRTITVTTIGTRANKWFAGGILVANNNYQYHRTVNARL